MMTRDTKNKVSARLRRIEGQVAALVRMVEEDRYCVDVLLQLASARGALAKAGEVILRSHVESCVTAALRSGKAAERKQKIDELMEVFSRYGGAS